MTCRRLACALLLAACAHPAPGPTVVAWLQDPIAWTAADRQAVTIGAAAWVAIGFRYAIDADPHLPECPTDWHQRRLTHCAITVTVAREVGLQATTGVSGMTSRERREIVIDSQWRAWALTAILAHELGHILLATGRHLAAGAIGVMQAAGAQWAVSPADRALACETVHRGC